MTDVLREITQASLGRIRKTSETPPRVSVLDVIKVITGTSPTICSHTLSRLEERFQEVGGMAVPLHQPMPADMQRGNFLKELLELLGMQWHN